MCLILLFLIHNAKIRQLFYSTKHFVLKNVKWIDLFPERQLVSSSRGPESNLIEIKFRSKLSDNPGNNFREKHKIKIAEIP